MAKYNVGDKVTVRSDLEIGGIYYMESGGYSDSFEESMALLAGQEVTIGSVDDFGDGEHYSVEEDVEDGDSFNWVDSMFVDQNQEKS